MSRSPAPWHWGQGPSEVLCEEGIIDADGSPVFVNCGRVAGDPTDDDRALMLAGPALLAACKAMLPIIADAIVHGMPIAPEVADARNLAVSSIAQAEGRPA